MLNDDKYKNFSSKEFLLYILLLNRLNLSKKNSKHFCDKNGFFVFYSRKQIMKDIRCSQSTVSTVLNNLENAGLIHKEYQGNGKPIKIYVNDIRENNIQKPKPKAQEISFNIESALQKEKSNRINFGEMKNPRIRHKKTTWKNR